MVRMLPFVLVVALGAQDVPARAQEQAWPREIRAGTASIIIYQPQIDSLKGNQLFGRAASSVTTESMAEPVFGAFWFQANMDVDRDAGTAELVYLNVTRVRFPNATEEHQRTFASLVEREVPKWALTVSLDRLTASVAASERERRSAEGLQHVAPRILFAREPTVLLLYDGEPVRRPVPGSPYQRVVNTPFLVAYDSGAATYFLSGGASLWYSARDPLGPWNPGATPPADLAQQVPPDTALAATSPSGPPPRILVATEPTELVVTTGAPSYQTLAGTSLLYVDNTESNWFKDSETQRDYLLLSGRWFTRQRADGPWTFVRADSLPAIFARIPPDSPRGDVRAFVAGTVEAEEALADAQIPQTAAIDRAAATLTVAYDGDPHFEAIPGTDVSYAVNTATQVLRIDERYYAVDNAVWFVAPTPAGPWAVSDSVPAAVKTIPPSSPVYNVQYVEVYQSTPQVVYVGYTPGYIGAYPYGGCMVYGTGWYYPPYYGPIYYYPRPVTYGFHVAYNPWTGWGFGMTWSNGFVSVGIGFGGGYPGYRPPYGGWYGRGGYRPVTCVNCTINVGGGRGGAGTRPSAGQRPSNSVYNRPETRDRNASRDVASRNRPQAAPAARGPNNVLADREGNVYRNQGGEWQRRQGGSWQPDRSAPTTRPTPSSRPGTGAGSVQRDWQGRQRGATRDAARAAPRPAPRGGGGRRR